MQARVRHQLGDDQQDVLGGGPLVAGGGGQPAPVLKRLADEVTGAGHGTADADQAQSAHLAHRMSLPGLCLRGAGGLTLRLFLLLRRFRLTRLVAR